MAYAAARVTPPPAATERLFVSTTPGLEPALERELRRLKLRVQRVPGGGGVEVEGPEGTHRRVNLESRVASRVLLRVGAFAAADARALQRGLADVALESFVAKGEPVSVSSSSHRSRLGAGQLKELAARVWKVVTPDVNEGSGPLEVQLRLEGDVCTVSVDTSGELLYRRGYRQEVSRAPLRETLAAGVLEFADYRGDEPLWDPMCGSGTFVIEAALIAMGRAPGMMRERFGFEAFPHAFDAEAFASMKDGLRTREKVKPPHELRATDLNAGSLGVARRNARRAGVLPFLTLERDDVTAPKHLPGATHGLLVTNPPYGKRVGEGGDLPSLYAALGTLLRERLPGWRGAVLVPAVRRGTPDVQLERALGLEPEDVFELDNGGIPLRLLLFAASRQLR